MFSIGMMAGPTIETLLFQKNEAMLWATCRGVGLLSAVLALLTGASRSHVTVVASLECGGPIS